jgi:hypothetical protein
VTDVCVVFMVEAGAMVGEVVESTVVEVGVGGPG